MCDGEPRPRRPRRIHWQRGRAIAALATFALVAPAGPAQGEDELVERAVSVDAELKLEQLLMEEDSDGDRRVTIWDTYVQGSGRGDDRFWLRSQGGDYEVVGTYQLGNLVQDLARASIAGPKTIELRRIFADPVTRTTRSIATLYWDELTRRIDAEHLAAILRDEKVADAGKYYLYVPHCDQRAYRYYEELARRRPALNLEVVRLPDPITPEYVDSLRGRHGLLSLALQENEDGELVGVPFVVPGGRFNEMYGWDSYFIVLGLLEDGRVELAKSMVDNFVYQIRHYGKILNANRTYYLTRSQPPFLTSMARVVYEQLPPTADNRDWLKTAIQAALDEYREVWTAEHRLVEELGLSRYYGSGIGPPPEVQPGAFRDVYAPYARACDMTVDAFAALYRAGDLPELLRDGCNGARIAQELDRHFVHDRCARESGHDTTFRWRWGWYGKDRCADFVTVDLNALLYKYELDIARSIEREFGGALARADGSRETSGAWYERARERKRRLQHYLWDEERGLFFDYDFVRQQRHPYVSATTLYPLWAGHDAAATLARGEQAERLLETALPQLEAPGGVLASTRPSRGPVSTFRSGRQWDYPHGWAPHQILIWRALLQHGREKTAHRLIYRWLYTITRTAADYNGMIPEKLDVVARSFQTDVEYGNVATEFALTTAGFGWTNASYQIGLALLPEHLHDELARLVPPEWIFGAARTTPP